MRSADTDRIEKKLTIVESGFERIPRSRRAQAFRANEQGWAEPVRSVERHVSR